MNGGQTSRISLWCCMNGGPTSRFLAIVLLQVVRPLDDSPEAAHTAEVVNELSAAIRQVLEASQLAKQLFGKTSF